MASNAVFLANMTNSACPLQRKHRTHEQRIRLAPPRANHDSVNKLTIDRRDMLLALGGTAAVATAVTTPGGVILPAMAAPIAPPDLSACHVATAPAGHDHCCPPYSTANVIDYDFPNTPLRVRRPAQEVKNDPEYMAKYTEAIRKMKELPAEHPWNFYQQALIHCAYCNEAYDQVGYPGVSLQVHYSWLFLPWHRYYLHFYERILGKLINDDTFTLPFWNFDAEDGMTLPEIFKPKDLNSPLYNPTRDENHYYPAILDYKYSYGNTTGTGLEGDALKQANMSYMRTTYKNSLQLPELFMGDPFRAGDLETKQATGGLEAIHNAIHQWVGTTDKDTSHVDMGNFSTAARDCVFFTLHANVDRLWHVYRNMRGNRVEFNEPDWLDASFIFYDENERVVRVKVRDSLNPSKLRFTYEDVPIPWLTTLPVQKTSETKEKSKKELKLVRVDEFGTKPREIKTEPLRVIVARPKTNRKKKEKQEKVELIKISDIQVTSHGPARFDVYLAKPYGDLAGPEFGEFAGSFVKLPHSTTSASDAANKPAKSNGKKTALKLGLTALLEDIEADDADKLIVTIVPRGGDITIGSVEIKLVKADSPGM